MSEFTRSEKPFFLLTKDSENNISYYWLDNEDELRNIVVTLKSKGYEVLEALEIQSCRDVELESIYDGCGLIDETFIQKPFGAPDIRKMMEKPL